MEESPQTNQPDQSLIRDAARHLYETTPATFDQVGEDVGVSARTVKRWAAADGGWSKLGGPEITARAQAVADTIQTAVTDLGPHAGDEERQEVTARLREDAAISLRAQLLDRHRSELNGPRRMIYEGLRAKDHEMLKMGKTAIEALDRLQQAERRAWCLDPADVDKPAVVVIERC